MLFKRIRDHYRLYMLFGVILLSIGLGVVQLSCYPGDEITSSDTDVVITFYDPGANFSDKIFAMPDTIIHVSDSENGSDNVTRLYDQQILNRIKQNLEDYGYTEVADPAQADVVIITVATTTTYAGSGCYYSYWDYWYGYPGYCYPVAYSYTTGTVIFAMVTADNTEGTDAMWVASLNGLVSESSSVSISTRINEGIDQAFDQSPYLK
jgi:hypothetical protein